MAGWGWNCGWGPGRNNVVINNNFINNNHFNRVNVAAGNNWVHNPGHRGGVPYASRGVSNRFNARNNVIARPTINQTQQRLNQAGSEGTPDFRVLSTGLHRTASRSVAETCQDKVAPAASRVVQPLGGEPHRDKVWLTGRATSGKTETKSATET